MKSWFKMCVMKPGMVVYTREQRQADLCEFEARLVFIARSRPARATQTLSQTNKWCVYLIPVYANVIMKHIFNRMDIC